ncbi:MAG: serine hydrolase [Acidobacteriota bacterium]
MHQSMHKRSRRFTTSLALMLVLAVAGAVRAQSKGSEDKAARIDALLERYQQLGLFNGSALVAERGRLLLDKGYGMADFEMGVPNSAATKHWIGSVTKIFTATAVLRLADEGKLSLDDRLSDLLPWYRKDTGARVSVRQLLNHTSGIPDYMHLPGIGREGFRRAVGDDLVDVKDFALKWCSADLAWEPGTKWGYSNSGYFLLAAIVEQVTGKPYEEALRELVLDPAGMRDTEDLARRPRAVVPGLTPGYEKAGGKVVTRRPWNLSTAFGAGAMVATVDDLYRFDRALDREGFLSGKSMEAMFTEGLGHYGCGWEVRFMAIGPGRTRRTVAGHEGFIFWSLARIYRIPEDGVFVALVNNTGDAPLPAVFDGIADLLYGREPAWPKPSAAGAVTALAFDKGAGAALKRYEEMKAVASGDYLFDEKGLNVLGYALLQGGKADDAVVVFRCVATSFPDSGNAWDSLGEGLAAAGRREEAVKAYARSLELQPSNRNAVERLDALTKP